MRFRLKSLLISMALLAIMLAVVTYVRDQRREAWSGLQSNGVFLVASRGKTFQRAELWVSTIDEQTFEINGERLSQREAKNKLMQIRQDLRQLGVSWMVMLDSEPGSTNTRQSSFDLVYSAGFTHYNIGSQGNSVTYDGRHTGLKSRNLIYEPSGTTMQ